MSEAIEVRRRLLAGGYSPLPLIGKQPVLKDWQKHDGVSDLEMGFWSTHYPAAANTGILTRLGPALDVDILDPEAAAAVEALAKERFEEIGFVPVRFGRFPKRAILFRTDTPFSKITASLIAPDGSPGQRLEFLCDGQQLVIDGVHPDTGQPYGWHGGAPGEIKREDLPYIHQHEALALISDAGDLLVADFAYRRPHQAKIRAKRNGAGEDEPADWAVDFSDHDALAAMAMKLLRSGMRDGAAVNFLRGHVGALVEVEEDRKARRLKEIPAMVASARANLDGEARPSEPSTHADEPSAAQLKVFDVGDEDGNIPPRQWLLGTTFCRRNLSGLISAGAAGKTTVRIVQALSIAADRSLTGEHVFARCRVMIICLEDDMTELRRRVRAAMLHNKVTPPEVKGFLILTTPRGLKIAELEPKTGKVVAGGLYRALVKAIDDLKLDVVCIDPAIKAHSVRENDNPEIDAFASMLTDLGAEKNIAIDLLSHERKAGAVNAGDINRSRGAGSQKDAQRLAYTLTGMSETEAATLGVGEDERAFLVRLDSAKVNIAPPCRTATWFRLVGVNLDNGNAIYPNGDNVQTVELWKPVRLFGGLFSADLNCVLRKLNAGIGNGQRYSLSPGAKERAAWHAVQEKFPEIAEGRCRAIITAWKNNQLFETGEYEDPVRRTKATGILSAKLIGLIEDDE